MYRTEPKADELPHCKNCRFWAKSSDVYGKCLKIGENENLRFAYEPGQVLPMTPRFGLCDHHEVKRIMLSKNELSKRHVTNR